MNRLALMVLRNILRVPGLFSKLCHYAKYTDRYPEQEKWDHISHIMQLAIKAGNVDLQVTGLENLPQEGPFMLYPNHQGMFDVVAIAAILRIILFFNVVLWYNVTKGSEIVTVHLFLCEQ